MPKKPKQLLRRARNPESTTKAPKAEKAAPSPKPANGCSVQRSASVREQKPRAAAGTRWVVEGSYFGQNWVEIIDAKHRTARKAMADMRSIAKGDRHILLRVVEVVPERRNVLAYGGAKQASNTNERQ